MSVANPTAPAMHRIEVAHIKVALPLPVSSIPADLVPQEGPARDVVLMLALAGTTTETPCRIGGKNFRRETVRAASGEPTRTAVLLVQGRLEVGPSGPVIAGATLSNASRNPRPAAEPKPT